MMFWLRTILTYALVALVLVPLAFLGTCLVGAVTIYMFQDLLWPGLFGLLALGVWLVWKTGRKD